MIIIFLNVTLFGRQEMIITLFRRLYVKKGLRFYLLNEIPVKILLF